MGRRLFGTDGIRGVAGEAPLEPKTVWALGAALGEWVAHHGSPRVVIGMDTRESGPWLAEMLAGGLQSAGVASFSAGMTTTPGVSYLTRSEDFVAGVMISASHNPYRDNGIKIFAHDGFKLPDADELALEDRIFAILEAGVEAAPLKLEADETYDRHYVNYLAGTFGGTLAGKKIVLDCANGAASVIGPELFRRLGAEVIATGCEPDGKNINLNCGALHVEGLRARVLEEQADFGAAFDGDADRCMVVSHSGKVLDGDHCMLVAAKRLRPRAVVATVMSNLGLERALAAEGIGLIRANVGDRYVIETMLKEELPLGGEQSGHVIFREFSTTGDGLLTALRTLQVAVEEGKTLDELTADFVSYPQRLVNVRFKEKRPLEGIAEVQAAMRATEAEFGDRGRVNVRFSGTEPLARVMVEGPDEERVLQHAQAIARAIEIGLS